MSIVDRRLIDVLDRIQFNTKRDFDRFLPSTLSQPFTNKMLAEKSGDTVSAAQKMTYCLKKMDLVREVGKRGNELLFEVTR